MGPTSGFKTPAVAAAAAFTLKTFYATLMSTAAPSISMTQSRQPTHPLPVKTTLHAAPTASSAVNNPTLHSNHQPRKGPPAACQAQTLTQSSAYPASKSTPNATYCSLTSRARQSNTTTPAKARPPPKSSPFPYRFQTCSQLPAPQFEYCLAALPPLFTHQLNIYLNTFQSQGD